MIPTPITKVSQGLWGSRLICWVYQLKICSHSLGGDTRHLQKSLTLNMWGLIDSVQHSKYRGCWCPGALRRQGINTHVIDYIEYVGPCLTRGMISTTWVKSVWRNDIKCKYMFMLPVKNLARKGLIKPIMLSTRHKSFQDEFSPWHADFS